MKFRPNKNFFIVLGIDLFLFTASWYLAHLIRFDFNIPHQFSILCFQILPFILITKIVNYYFFELYRGMWRYTSIADLFNIIKATSLSTLIIFSLIIFTTRFEGFSRSVFIIDWCFTILFISGYRIVIRFYFEHLGNEKPRLSSMWKALRINNRKRRDSKRLIIVGAGNWGEKIYREIRDNAQLKYNVVGFLDDDPEKVGRHIHGIPVLSYIRDIKDAIKILRAEEVLIAIPSTNSQQVRNIVEKCKDSDVKSTIIPSMSELINGKVTLNAIREVAYRDLLGREVIKLDEERIGAYLQGQYVLVSGAGGSIGSELCRQICRFRPEGIILYDRAETPLFKIELELVNEFPYVKIIAVLGDIRDRTQLAKSFSNYRPNVVFHAAAYKHVPIIELQPWKAIKNNILGTRNMIDISRQYSIERFVFVSTDKAVRPVNIMGASKRVAEILVQSQNGSGYSDSPFVSVRFGNVVGSEGSVVPIFKKQIENGGPVTVTHPEMTRYFMTITESCQLILQAGAMGKGGEIFILDMGTPVKIDDMARDLIRLSGFEPEVDIKIEHVGLRPGEKLYEELITKGEDIVTTSHEKIMALKGEPYDQKFLNDKIDELRRFAQQQDAEKIKEKLKEIVPEYKVT